MIRKHLGKVLHELAAQKNCQIVEGNLMPDHVHMCINIPPKYSAPNLNLIERYWKFFKKKILYGRYYETFSLFKSTYEAFFIASDHYKAELRPLLTDNFQIIGSA